MLTVQEALKEIENLVLKPEEEIIPLDDALGRVLAEEVYADRDYPPFNRASMDGIAIKSEDFLLDQITQFHVVGEVFAGMDYTGEIAKGSCIKIMTGAPVPRALNAVIRVEDTVVEGDKIRVNLQQIAVNQNISLQGEDIGKGELILSKNIALNVPEISSLAVVGKSKVKVYKLPSVAVISTGDEVKPIDQPVSATEIRNSNFYAIQAFLQKFGIPVSFKMLIKDDKQELLESIQKALNYDILITSGGVSMGDADFLPTVFQQLGIEKVFHKVEVKPGKPLWVGKTEKTVVFGLPGNPVSVQVGCRIFIRAFLRKMLGYGEQQPFRFPLLEEKKKKTKFDEFFPCKYQIDETVGLKLVKFNGSGDITAALQSDGIALHPSGSSDLTKGDMVKFFPWD